MTGDLDQKVPKKILIVEVGPRDGFQMESKWIPTELKVRVIDQLSTSGIGKIETTSFVRPKVIPQMSDALQVMQSIRKVPGVIYSGLVANARGAQRAIEAGVHAIRMVICASESYNQRNAGMPIAASTSVSAEVLKMATSNGTGAEVAIGLAFGCPLEGEVPEAKVLGLVARLVDLGFQEIALADSVGVANPVQVRRMVRRVLAEFPQVHFSLHIHNTRGLGLVNVLAALEEGIDTFDASLGGLGGCPVVTGGSGNIATEDLVNMLHEMGLTTGIDVEAVMSASRMMMNFLQRQLPSHVLAAGTREQLYRAVQACARETS